MRRRTVIAFVTIAVAACGESYGADETPAPDAGADAVENDSGVVVAEGASDARPIDDAAADAAPADDNCATFAPGVNHGFELSGLASIDSAGLLLDLKKSATASALRSFTATKPILRSTVTIDGTITAGSGSWSSISAAFVTIMEQYYGSTQATTAAAPATHFTLSNANDAGTSADFELSNWSAPNVFEGVYRIGPFIPSTSTTTVKVTTDWAASGTVAFAYLGASVTLPVKTNAGAKKNIFTLLLGGKANSGSTPDIKMLVKKVCVDFL